MRTYLNDNKTEYVDTKIKYLDNGHKVIETNIVVDSKFSKNAWERLAKHVHELVIDWVVLAGGVFDDDTQ